MNVLLTQTILAARNSEGDDAFWVQMLVVVILAVSFGIFSLVKAKANKSKVEDTPQPKRAPVGKSFKLSGAARTKPEGLRRKREKDLESGMELLGKDFLLSIVEKTNGGDDEKDVAMRKLNFKELARRGELSEADSKALKAYALNKGNLYGKDIQCEALKRLAERTAKGKTGN
ncbi:MAG: hypothetical protein WC454_07060 [Phycisphaerae bacterium]|jgi:hypothetical protein